MSDFYFKDQAKDDFNKARKQQFIKWLLSVLDSERNDLLALQDVKDLIKPKKEFYKGMKTVLISQIAGSEGRYRDFNREFLPKHEHLRARWERVDVAHLQDKILPPIRLYEVGGSYFVRDGNHRVSVARMQGVKYIDAEIIVLDSKIIISPDMSTVELKQKVIEYEKERFFDKTGLCNYKEGCRIEFTAPGRYDEILFHIAYHKEHIEKKQSEEEIPFKRAAVLWYEEVFMPFKKAIIGKNILERFPNRTVGDLYVWTERHWKNLENKLKKKMSIEEAVDDYNEKYGKSFWRIIRGLFKKRFGKKR